MADLELLIGGQHYDRVVRDGILRARVSLDIATADFKAMFLREENGRGGQSVIEELKNLAGKGVEIRILHGGVPSSVALRNLRGPLADNLIIRRCPRMHAKLVIVDCRQMYVGSANLTGAGLGAKSESKRNFEIGVWTSLTDLIDSAQDYFNSIWEGRWCEECGRRDVCPVPLEEPDLPES